MMIHCNSILCSKSRKTVLTTFRVGPAARRHWHGCIGSSCFRVDSRREVMPPLPQTAGRPEAAQKRYVQTDRGVSLCLPRSHQPKPSGSRLDDPQQRAHHPARVLGPHSHGSQGLGTAQARMHERSEKRILLVGSKTGQCSGIVKLTRCLKLTTEEVKLHESKHRVAADKIERYANKTGCLYAWMLAEPHSLQNPMDIERSQGSMSWVKVSKVLDSPEQQQALSACRRTTAGRNGRVPLRKGNPKGPLKGTLKAPEGEP